MGPLQEERAKWRAEGSPPPSDFTVVAAADLQAVATADGRLVYELPGVVHGRASDELLRQPARFFDLRAPGLSSFAGEHVAHLVSHGPEDHGL